MEQTQLLSNIERLANTHALQWPATTGQSRLTPIHSASQSRHNRDSLRLSCPFITNDNNESDAELLGWRLWRPVYLSLGNATRSNHPFGFSGL